MATITEMPVEEKYNAMVDRLSLVETVHIPFVTEHFGQQSADELKSIYEEGTKLIPEEAGFEEKYELAYSNWVWRGKNIYKFIRDRMGDEGIKEFEKAMIKELKKKNAGPSLTVLKIIRVFAPGKAFVMAVQKLGYKMQWLSPLQISEFTPEKMVVHIPQCKIQEFKGTFDICRVGCRSTNPRWLAEQFKIKMTSNRQGKQCTHVFTPL